MMTTVLVTSVTDFQEQSSLNKIGFIKKKKRTLFNDVTCYAIVTVKFYRCAVKHVPIAAVFIWIVLRQWF